MRCAQRLIVVLLILVQFTGLSFAFDWTTDQEKAFQKSKESNKPLVVYCYHPRTLKDNRPVWLHPLVQKFSSKFVGLHVNMGEDGGFINKHKIQEYPAVLFFDADGNELIAYRYEDRLKRTELAMRMRKVLDSIEEFELVKTIVVENNTKDPRFIYQYAKGMRDRGFFDESEQYFNRLLHQDLDDQLMLQVKNAYINMFFLKASRSFYEGNYDVSIDTLHQYMSRYPGDEAMNQAKFLLGLSFYESGAKKEGEKVLNALAKDSSAGLLQAKAKMYLDEKKG